MIRGEKAHRTLRWPPPSFISAPIPILLEDICFSGLMRIRLKLITTFPHIQIVEMSFLERPIFGQF